MQLDKSMLTAYQNRWNLVAEVEAAEQQQTSVAQRWQKLNALVRMAAGLDILKKEDDDQVQIVRQRWIHLKKLYLAEIQGQTT